MEEDEILEKAIEEEKVKLKDAIIPLVLTILNLIFVWILGYWCWNHWVCSAFPMLPYFESWWDYFKIVFAYHVICDKWQVLRVKDIISALKPPKK